MKTSPVPPKETPTGDASSLVNLGYISVDYPEDLPLAEEAMRGLLPNSVFATFCLK